MHLPATTTPGGRGLWLAHHLTGALTLTRRPDGLTATVTASLPPGPSGDRGDHGPAAVSVRPAAGTAVSGQRFCFCWQGTQKRACGRISRRSRGISVPHFSQLP
ncbi:hypothetical protein GCM10029963_07010 [Micromonospora andamanensis]